MSYPEVASASEDFATCSLGDARRDKRLAMVADALQAKPTCSFPEVFGSGAATEAFYRFMASDHVSWRPIFEAHADATRKRAASVETILAVHDTTLAQFGGKDLRAGTFRSAKSKSGFLAHTALAVSADGSRRPLGLLGMIPVVRLEGEEAAASPGVTYENESHRWSELVDTVEREARPEVRMVHVMDSEGDNYNLLEHMVRTKADFVVRMCHDRRVATPYGLSRLNATLGDGVTMLTRTVKVSQRQAPKGQKASVRHAAREERSCVLEARVLDGNILRPQGSEAHFAALHLHIVHVVEVDPPAGEEPVSWVLATTLPVDTGEQVAMVVDAYRARWLIEEWFKALKTGCAYETRQLESLDALLVAFALLAPIATRLLSLRWFARTEPDRPATDVLSAPEIDCLRLIETRHKRKFPVAPTVNDAMMAIARIGGFLTSNKVPGWQILGRGFEEFLSMFGMFQMMRGGESAEM